MCRSTVTNANPCTCKTAPIHIVDFEDPEFESESLYTGDVAELIEVREALHMLVNDISNTHEQNSDELDLMVRDALQAIINTETRNVTDEVSTSQ